MNNFFWFETNRVDQDNYLSYYFQDPIDIIKLENRTDLFEFFKKLENVIKKYYAAGFFSYELGYLFEEKLNFKKKSDFPYALFFIYQEPAIYNHRINKFINYSTTKPFFYTPYQVHNLLLNTNETEYEDHLQKIKDYIYQGDIYQANYTMKYKFDFQGSPYTFYEDLKRKQKVSYNVFAHWDNDYIISLSPELFFSKSNDSLQVKPMKGTIGRGRDLEEDIKYSNYLKQDRKNQSENVMIVDLLRNDLGKISEYGSVNVKKLFEVEEYDTLFQMTSTIESQLKKNIPLFELIKSLFPSGSVTGAPKIRSMEIIHELEKEDRKIYTGALGFFGPKGRAKFNIAIRTILLRGNQGEMGIGSGIVYDSIDKNEFKECELKAQFLFKKPEVDFQLIETLLYKEQFEHLNLHLKRLQASARYFDFSYDENHILSTLYSKVKNLNKDTFKIRLLLNASGKINVFYEKLNQDKKKYKIGLSKIPINSQDKFYFHKTTNRELYEDKLKKAKEKGLFDIIFFNEKGELTEGARSNIYIEKNDQLFTPPINCGLLNGIMRQILLKKKEVREQILLYEEIYQADRIYISNSIIGFQQAQLINSY